jgi:20S proteasome alpha/beta subunit
MRSGTRNLISQRLSLGMVPSDLRKSLRIFLSFILLCTARSGAATSSEPVKPVPIHVKGSFVIAAICKDGIIVASDSRGMLKDREGRRIAYYDINQKIFPVGNKLIADTGYASLDDPKLSFLSALMFRFAKSPLARVQIDQLPNSYFKYTSAVLPATGATSARVQTLIFAGFKKNRPLLCLYQGESNRTTKCRSSGYISSPRQQIVGLRKVPSLSFQEAAHLMQQAIEDYAAAVQPGSVGGPVVVRTITPSSSAWLDKPPCWPSWETFGDLAKDYKTDRVLFQLMPGVNKAQLDILIEGGAAWAGVGQNSNPGKAVTAAPVIGSYHADR